MQDEAYKVAQELMSDSAFNTTLMEIAQNNKMELIANPTTGVAPKIVTFFAEGKHRAAVMVMPELPEGEDKHKLFFLIGIKLSQENLKPLACFMVAESWFKRFTPKEFKDKNKKELNISDYEDKEEVFMVAGRTLDGRNNSIQYKIIRDTKNNMSLSGELIQKYEPTRKGGDNILLGNIFKGYIFGWGLRKGMASPNMIKKVKEYLGHWEISDPKKNKPVVN